MSLEHPPRTSDDNRHPTHAGSVIDDLKRVAPLLGYSGYQPLMRAYIGQGLRADLARLLENLKAQGVSEETLTKALADLSAG